MFFYKDYTQKVQLSILITVLIHADNCLYVGVTQGISGFLPERTDPCVAVLSGHPWGEGILGASYVAIWVTSVFSAYL